MSRRSMYTTGSAFLLAVLVLFAFGLAGSRASAQQSPDCEDPDTIACLPVTDSGGTAPPAAAQPSAGGATSAAPNAAAAPGAAPPPIATRAPCEPPFPVPNPPYPPYPLPYGDPAAAAAPPSPAPVPLPPFCFNDVYATINRANLAYARAMRSLNPALLYPYWGQDALHDLQGQINTLRATNSYRVLRLVSTSVLEQNLYPGYAWVHTSEHWITATWSNNGYQYDSNDAWYDNQYFLYQAGGRWVIGSDIVN